MLRIVLLVVLVACAPEAEPGLFFCGPERLCPDDLVCDGVTFTCETPNGADPFSCRGGANDFEPDDSEAQAQVITAAVCGAAKADTILGCLIDDDQDFMNVLSDSQCETRDLDIRASSAIAAADVEVSVNGEVLQSSPCEIAPTDGFAYRCSTITVTGDALFKVRLSGTGDCNGECRANSYRLDVTQK